MPTREAPADVNQPTGSAETALETVPPPELPAAEPEPPQPASEAPHTSRWIDYDTHELLQMISELEDERRWARLREGILWAVLIHIFIISAITWIPRYVFKVPPVIDPFQAIKERPDLAYLNLPPDALREHERPKIVPKPLKQPLEIDKKTLQDLNRENPPAPPPQEKAPVEPKPQPAPPIPPAPQSQSTVEAPRPAAVPARPNFAMNSQSPSDQLRDAMRNAMRNRGGENADDQPAGGLSLHPGAGTGGVQVLSDTQGVDFSSWLARWHYETEKTWDPLIPDEVNPPILKSGMVAIRFKVLPNGRLMDGSVVLEGRSGDVALDRAAWGALVGSDYPPLPREFHGPYIELRAFFLYNMQPPQQ